MSDANISDEGRCQECDRLSNAWQRCANKLTAAQDENKRLRDSLSDCLTLLKECSYDATEVTEKARKLLNQ